MLRHSHRQHQHPYRLVRDRFILFVSPDYLGLPFPSRPELNLYRIPSVGTPFNGSIPLKTKLDSQFPLHNKAPTPHHLSLPITHHNDIIGVIPPGHELIMSIPRLLIYVPNRGEYAQYVEEAGAVVGALEWADGVFRWEGGGDGGGDEGWEEERAEGGGGGGGRAGGRGPHRRRVDEDDVG